MPERTTPGPRFGRTSATRAIEEEKRDAGGRKVPVSFACMVLRCRPHTGLSYIKPSHSNAYIATPRLRLRAFVRTARATLQPTLGLLTRLPAGGCRAHFRAGARSLLLTPPLLRRTCSAIWFIYTPNAHSFTGRQHLLRARGTTSSPKSAEERRPGALPLRARAIAF